MVEEDEELLNQFFEGDIRDLGEGEEYKTTEEEEAKIAIILEKLENPPPYPITPTYDQPTRTSPRQSTMDQSLDRPNLNSYKRAKRCFPEYFELVEERKRMLRQRNEEVNMFFSQVDEVVKGSTYVKGETTTPQRATQGYLKTIKPMEGLTEIIRELALKCSQIYVHSIKLLYFQIIRLLDTNTGLDIMGVINKFQTTYKDYEIHTTKSFPGEGRMT